MSILKLFNDFKEVLKSSWSDLRASKIAPGGAGNGPGATKEVNMVDLGVILGSFWGRFGVHLGVILGVQKCPRKKRVEKVKIVFSCRRHADSRGFKGSEF